MGREGLGGSGGIKKWWWKKRRSRELRQASDICSVQNGYKPCKRNQSLDSFDLYSHTADWPWSA